MQYSVRREDARINFVVIKTRKQNCKRMEWTYTAKLPICRLTRRWMYQQFIHRDELTFEQLRLERLSSKIKQRDVTAIII
jgi:hypothetical protein